jgi:hypothetical protein
VSELLIFETDCAPQAIYDSIQQRFKGKPGIVYCFSKKEAEALAHYLQKQGENGMEGFGGEREGRGKLDNQLHENGAIFELKQFVLWQASEPSFTMQTWSCTVWMRAGTLAGWRYIKSGVTDVCRLACVFIDGCMSSSCT